MLQDSRQQQRAKRRMNPALPLLGWVLTTLLISAAYYWIVRPDLRFSRCVATHGVPAVPAMAFTFDDGPHPLWAPLLADTLERHGARGTFFLVGFEAQRYPELTMRLARAGHQIGNHSLSHPYPNLTVLPPEQLAYEVRTAQQILQQLAGPAQQVRDFRPPGGGVNNALITLLANKRWRMAWWSYNVGDWNSPPAEVIANRLRSAVRPGQVILMHQRENSVAALEEFLADRRRQEYTYPTFEALMWH